MSKININDPEEWSKMDWSDPVPLKIRSNQAVGVSRANRLRAQDPEWQKKHAEHLKKIHADPVWRKKVDDSNKQKAKDPAWLKTNAEKLKKMHADPEIQQKRIQAQQEVSCKPIQIPYGVFSSLKAAIIHVSEYKLTSRTTLISVRKFIIHKLKSDPTNYYYITKEEYAKLVE
jgi:hypothetical protein